MKVSSRLKEGILSRSYKSRRPTMEFCVRVLWARVFNTLVRTMVLVCGLQISTLVAKTAEHPIVAPRPLSRVMSKHLVLRVTMPKAEVPRAGTVRTNPKNAEKYVWIPPGEFEIGCSPADNECKGSERRSHSMTV